MKKIIFVLLLAVLMLFVSCGKSESKTSSTSGTATETSTKTAEKKKIEINVLGTMYFTRALIASMIQNRYGRVVNVSSVAGVYGIRNMVDYSTTKGAINAFTLALAKEVTEFGVTVNSVSPGNILSDSNLEKDNPELSFAGRSGTNKECADVICFLASEKASYVSGQNYIVDGCRKKM